METDDEKEANLEHGKEGTDGVNVSFSRQPIRKLLLR